MEATVLTGFDQVSAQLSAFYRDLHEHPELSLHEHRTARRVADALRPVGFEVTEQVGGTGVVGVLRNGGGPVVLVRADLDALPVEEKTGLPYASTARGTGTNGREVPVMHACGHDMHTTCLLGAATLLARATSTWSGTLLAVFQPAEELGCGAQNMVDDGLFLRFPKPDIVLSQHVSPLPAGMIGHAAGPIMAAADSVKVILHGRGGHGSHPAGTVDPVLMAAHIITRLQGIVAREVAPDDFAVVTVGRIRAGTKTNIIPDTAELGINVRTYSAQTRALVHESINRIIHSEATASAAPRPPELEWTAGVPVLVSDPSATATTVAAFAEHFGEQRLHPLSPLAASEDIGALGEAAGAPTVYWLWGGLDADTVIAARRDGQRGLLPTNHSPHFAPVIEPTLSTGVQALVVAALTWLGKPAVELS